MKRRGVIPLALVSVIVLLSFPATGCLSSTTTTTVNYTINIGTSNTLGNYLVDQNGMALYYWAKDLPGKSNADASVIQKWPVFYTASVSVPSTLNASDFGSITRSDGSMQSTYKGWPLYRYSGDTAPGDTNGDGFAGLWFVDAIPFYTVMLLNDSTLGAYLTDAAGNTIYYYTKDSPGISAATVETIAVWPVFHVSDFEVPSALDVENFDTILRADGGDQSTYKNWPMYTYTGDTAAGDINGQGVLNEWYAIVPATFNP